ncbi:MAG: hypothetical protein ACI9F9_002163 [Candidatus Paceibacteria bacterium]|jgi:hypothetical protein
MKSSANWARYEQLTQNCVLGFLPASEHEELALLHEHFEFTPSDYESAASLVCMASLKRSRVIPNRLRDLILKRGRSLLGPKR